MKIQYNANGLLVGDLFESKISHTISKLCDNYNWCDRDPNIYPQCLIDTAMLSIIANICPEYDTFEEYSQKFLKHKYKKILYLIRFSFIKNQNITFKKKCDNIYFAFKYMGVEPDIILDLYDNLEEIEENSDIGYIYLMENNGYYKIGKTKFPNKRLETYYRTENPNPYQLIMYKKVYFYSILEKELHKTFESKRHNREWFNLNKIHIKAIKDVLNIFSVCE